MVPALTVNFGPIDLGIANNSAVNQAIDHFGLHLNDTLDSTITIDQILRHFGFRRLDATLVIDHNPSHFDYRILAIIAGIDLIVGHHPAAGRCHGILIIIVDHIALAIFAGPDRIDATVGQLRYHSVN